MMPSAAAAAWYSPYCWPGMAAGGGGAKQQPGAAVAGATAGSPTSNSNASAGVGGSGGASSAANGQNSAIPTPTAHQTPYMMYPQMYHGQQAVYGYPPQPYAAQHAAYMYPMMAAAHGAPGMYAMVPHYGAAASNATLDRAAKRMRGSEWSGGTAGFDALASASGVRTAGKNAKTDKASDASAEHREKEKGGAGVSKTRERAHARNRGLQKDTVESLGRTFEALKENDALAALRTLAFLPRPSRMFPSPSS